MTEALRWDERRTYVEWDVANWSVALDFWARETAVSLDGCDALEIGGRHGGLSLWLARRGAHVTCSDLGGPSARARAKHEAAGFGGRIRYRALDALALQDEARYDVIVFKSVLGALKGEDPADAPRRALAAMHRALRPGGELFFAENLAASPAHRFLREHFVDWGRRWRYLTLPELAADLAPFRSCSIRTAGFSGAFGRSAMQRRVLGALDRAGLDRLVPERWRYIAYGIAVK